jgi:hypothetical protein
MVVTCAHLLATPQWRLTRSSTPAQSLRLPTGDRRMDCGMAGGTRRRRGCATRGMRRTTRGAEASTSVMSFGAKHEAQGQARPSRPLERGTRRGAGATTGVGCFAEVRPSAKPLPSAALGKAPSTKIRSAKASLPRAVYRALSKGFAESPTLGKARNKKCEKT